MKKTNLVLLAVCAFALFQGCEKDTSGVANEHFRIAIVPNVPTASNEFWSLVRNGCDLYAEVHGGLSLDLCVVTNSSMEAQQETLRTLAASGVDGIAVSPVDAERQRPLLDEIASKTLLVCMDSDAAGSKRACYVGSDNVVAGEEAADLIKAALPEGGKIILFVGLADAGNAKDRIQGLRGALAGSGIEILDILEDGGEHDVALKNAQDALANHPDLAGLVGIYSYNGPAILSALRGTGKAGQVKIVCFDDDDATLVGIGAGDIYGTVVQQPFVMGVKAVFAMEHYLAGDKTALARDRILLPTRTVTQQDLETYQAWRDHRLGR